MVDKNCYFYIDENIPEDERCMTVICELCHKKTPKGWFWEGANRGYGRYNVYCDLCQLPIHLEKNTYEKDQTSV